MKQNEFRKITDMWTYTDIVHFVMLDNQWCDLIMNFIRENWKDTNDFTLEDLNIFAKKHGYPEQSQLELEE